MPLEMQQDIRGKIAALKIECGAWGRDRRFKYLIENCLRYDIEIEILQLIYNSDNWEEKAVILWVLKQWDKKQKPLLQDMANMLRPNMLRPKKYDITPEMIQAARDYPITQLIELNRNKARCISGTHEDKNPSMSFKNNYVHCFSCGYHADSIAVAMQLHNLSFPEAVKWLNS